MWVLILAIAGCVPDDPTETDAAAPTDTDVVPTYDCTTDLASLPLSMDKLKGFTKSEDFAFDDQGRFVGTDEQGNIVQIELDGDKSILRPNFGEAAGTAFLPTGDLVMANVETGSLERITPEGGQETVLGGLAYPNGVVVDGEGMVYVAEQNAGRVQRVDPTDGAAEVIAEGMYNPNGLALSPEHDILYIGSFGGAVVYRVVRDGAGWGAVEVFGETPGKGASACEGKEVGDECFLNVQGLGSCAPDPLQGLVCAPAVDEAACSGLTEGAACSTTALGAAVDSVCSEPEEGGALFCPKVPADVVTACSGKKEGAPCDAFGISASCEASWEGVQICNVTGFDEMSWAACYGLVEGSECIIEDFEGYAHGSCISAYGYAYCLPDFYTVTRGGLDGIGVDVCGNVYVTEYVVGYIWRFAPDGGDPELALESGSFWIPNMHWGQGTGGFDTDTMYVQDRETRGIFAVPIGVPGAPVPFPP